MAEPRTAPFIPLPELYTGSDPAVGAEITVTVPADEVWVVQSMYFTMLTSAVVANRVVTLVADDGSTAYWRSRGATNHPASNTLTYAAFPGAGVGENGIVQLVLPTDGLTLLPGHRLKTATTSLDVGDNFAAPVLYVVRYSA